MYVYLGIAAKPGIRKVRKFCKFSGKLKFLALKKFNIICTSHLRRFGILLTIKIASIASTTLIYVTIKF